MKLTKTLLTIGLISTAAFADGAFHMGAKFGGNYNMIWNVDNKITAKEILGNIGVPSYEIEEELGTADASINDLDKLSGMGFHFGFTFKYQVTDMFAIQPELLISYRGRSVKASVTGTDSENSYYDDDYYYYGNDDYEGFEETIDIPEIEINQWFFDIPILARIQTNMGLFFNIGPVLSFNMSSELKATLASIDIEDYVSTFVFGMAGGIGYSVDLGNGKSLDFDVRLHMGLTSLISDDIAISNDPTDPKFDGTKIVDPKDFNIVFAMAFWFI